MKNKNCIFFILFFLLALNSFGQQKRLILINLETKDSIIIKDSTRVNLDIDTDGDDKGKMIILSDSSIKIKKTIIKLHEIEEIGIKTDERKTIGYMFASLGIGGAIYGSIYYNTTPVTSGTGLIPIGNGIEILANSIVIELVSIAITTTGLLIANEYKYYKTINHYAYEPEKNSKFYRIVIQTF